MAVAALIVAILALVVSAASVAWQVYSWRRSGPHIRVTVSNSFPVFGQHIGEHHVQVTATNRGRAATTVQGWGFSLPGRQTAIVRDPAPWSTVIPHRLDPGTEASWFVDANEIRNLAAQHRVRFSDIVPFVRVAGGTEIHAERGVPLGRTE